MYPKLIQRDISGRTDTRSITVTQAWLAQIVEKWTRNHPSRQKIGGSTSNDNWRQREFHVGENIINNIHDKLTEFYANNIIHQIPEKKIKQ